MEQRIIRVLLGKSTMDAHDRGVRYLATKMREAGMEVIFISFFEPKEIIDTAIQEDVDVVGISSSSEGHIPVARETIKGLKAAGKDDVLVIFGGVIPDRDHAPMKALGVSAIFGPGSSADDLAKFLRENVRKQRVSFE
jgi:methylmalonyl-CoA mutase C-terminal domain/subunit